MSADRPQALFRKVASRANTEKEQLEWTKITMTVDPILPAPKSENNRAGIREIRIFHVSVWDEFIGLVTLLEYGTKSLGESGRLAKGHQYVPDVYEHRGTSRQKETPIDVILHEAMGHS